MFSFKLKRQEDLETFRDIADDVEESDFVPYTCHYNPHTIITKNGELLQTIKIVGLNHEMVGHEEVELRSTIREALKECLQTSVYAFWFHTIRRRVDLSAKGSYENDFAREVNESWEEINHFRKQYTNEVYITIVREGQDATVTHGQNFLRGIIPSKDLNWRNQYLDTIYQELNTLSEELLKRLDKFGAERLGVIKNKGVYYSELCSFLEKLINLVERPMPLVEQDLSIYLTSGEITFGFNAMEVRKDNRRRFASIITIKEYKEASLEAIDRFLHLPIEFIVTQCVDFINPSVALSHYLEQKEITNLSGDSELSEMTEVEHVLRSHSSQMTDFGQQQLMIFLLADNIKELERNVRYALRYLFEHGIVAIREDLRFEECYWAQLPGNFEFIKRLYPTSTSHLCGFANLHNYPAGQETGNHWGNAVTTFHTAAGTPYYFNFHNGNNGHTSIIGPLGTGKTVLVNFLLCQSVKFLPRIYYLDVTGSGGPLIQMLKGKYYSFAEHTPASQSLPPMNPFSLSPNESNKAFLRRWLGILVRLTGKELSDNLKADINEAIEIILKEPLKDRSFSSFIKALNVRNPASAAAFYSWLPEGPNGTFFNHQKDAFDENPNILGIDLKPISEKPELMIPVVSYILQKITQMLDESATILMLDEAWRLLRNSHIASDPEGWLNYLTSKNTLGIFSTEYVDEAGKESLTPKLFKHLATQIYLPNDHPSDVYAAAYGLNEQEITYLEAMEKEERHFLLKRDGETIVAELNLSGMPHILDILSGKPPRKSHQSNDQEGAEPFHQAV